MPALNYVAVEKIRVNITDGYLLQETYRRISYAVELGETGVSCLLL